ncbi:DUF2971 domain-containing protein [Marinibactrum halimedae]|uniref:DUF2971 domain-containing protein n=1 Tax=Marinibactrum halimedae TaxID=1444977 RepID=A0AA37TA08_9GAMM|nr:DUF2971 domain-containing protein [Marinibactrum halimedae]MCD9457987.1 DUF2971 domain-containing protein [Marinibactrum halimedae]GLS27613.1 hypothetical protein GCM10007877_33320 [Marinibactrum halimedae]
MPNHSPDDLVKFCDAKTAEKILTEQTLRWSAPHLFSDPFELNHETQLTYGPSDLLSATIKSASAMLFSIEAPTGNTPLLQAIRRWREEERFESPEEAEVVLKDLLAKMVDARLKVIDQIMVDWRRFTRTLRICSFCAKADNISAWQDFGDHHRGIAIRFQAGEYTALPNPKRVVYQNVRPEITSLKEQLSAIIHADPERPQDNFMKKFTTKPPFLSAHQEWRCFTQVDDKKDNSNQELFKDIRFERTEVKGIYFGVYTPGPVKKALYAKIKELYPRVKVYQCRALPGKYEIVYERIGQK